MSSRVASLSENLKLFLPSSGILSPNLFLVDQLDQFRNNFHGGDDEDLVSAVRSFLCIGRFIGFIPFAGVWKGNIESLSFRWKSFGFLSSCLGILIFGVHVIVGVVGFISLFTGQSLYDFTVTLFFAVHYGCGMLAYTFALMKANVFLRFLREWKSTKLHHNASDVNLKRDINLITIALFGSVVFSIFLREYEIHIAKLEYEEILKHSNDSMESVEEFSYRISEPHLSHFLPYNIFISIIMRITPKVNLMAWEMSQILLIIFSRAMYYKFKLLNRQAGITLLKQRKTVVHQKMEQNGWRHLVQDYIKLSKLLQSLDNFLSPLVFSSCALNLYYICLHITLALKNEKGGGSWPLFYNWVFLHIIIRFLMILISGAKINEHALNTRYLVQKCPSEIYWSEMIQFENQYLARREDVGLKGFGAFTLTRSLMLKILGVIFTVEIVLMQT